MESKNNSVVRILDITIQNFKNVAYGHIAFASSKTTRKQGVAKGRDILGIYGQNGSGKTALIEALIVWRQIMKDQPVEEELKELLQQDTAISITFFIQKEGERYLVSQQLLLGNENGTMQSENQLAYRKWDGERWSRRRILKLNGKELDKQLFHMLQVYAANGLWIATTKQLGYLNLNMGVAIDFTYQEDGILYEEQRISLFEKNYVTSQQLAQMDRMKEQMNLVLKAVLPDVCLGLHINELSVPEGKPEMYEVTLLSKRYGKEFPLYNESGGIKRLISILTILMAAYNSPSLMVVVDEIDAGVFEYLLGEFLEIMKNGAKGQFLFTSHNLRALEVLGNNHIIFSTANPKNRYIRFTRLRKNHNLRDEYLRTVLLGGQNELVYEDRGSCELGYAFRKAGSIYGRS